MYRQSFPHFRFRSQLCNRCQTLSKPAPSVGTEWNDRFAFKFVFLQKRGNRHRDRRPPYCVSKLIQLFLGRYRFYIYGKRSKINTFQNGRCTHAWTAIVLLVGIVALSIFHSVKFNDSLFLRVAIVIFCTQKINAIFSIPLKINQSGNRDGD